MNADDQQKDADAAGGDAGTKGTGSAGLMGNDAGTKGTGSAGLQSEQPAGDNEESLRPSGDAGTKGTGSAG